MSEARGRPPRWDPDERGIGVGDARRHLPTLDALRGAAAESGWVAEEPEAHLMPHVLHHVAGGAPLAIVASSTEPDGTLVLDLHWTGPMEGSRRDVRAAIHALIGVVAEDTTAVHVQREGDVLTFDVVTGVLPGESRFASHGHTLQLRISEPSATTSKPE